jgi:hypothetical protein
MNMHEEAWDTTGREKVILDYFSSIAVIAPTFASISGLFYFVFSISSNEERLYVIMNYEI